MGETGSGDGAQTPIGGLPRFLQVALGVVLVLAALMMLKNYSGIFGPIFLALNLMVTAYPLHAWLVRKGCPPALSAAVVALMVFVLLLAMVAGLIWAVNEIIGIIPQYADQFIVLYDQAISFASDMGLDRSSLTGVLSKIDPNSLLNAASSLLTASTGFLGGLSILVCTLVFIAMDTAGFAQRLSIAASTHSRIVAGFRSFSQGVRSYWIVTTVFGLIVAVLDVVALQIMGVSGVVVWGLLSFLTNYIPNIGFVVGLIPPALVALVSLGWKQAVAVIVIYCVLNFVVQTIIQPRFTGDAVGVTPTVSFISLLVWGAVLGALGTLLALPMTLLVKALVIDTDPRTKWVNALIASDPHDAEGAVRQRA
ncbi:AI-2E family transporter [uncultured Propionibacterium sp.]|uniref:AI-2E family transporter n=1 Tax=uncultured Propionibacterium sp. TaxID=218066 RepID=UPI002930A444|nr:AI-2E family transporter [uncultured Propionibacterium sp.]